MGVRARMISRLGVGVGLGTVLGVGLDLHARGRGRVGVWAWAWAWAWIWACVCGFGFGIRVERLHHRNQINDEPRAQVVCSDAVESDCPLATVLLKGGEEPEHEIEAVHDE